MWLGSGGEETYQTTRCDEIESTVVVKISSSYTLDIIGITSSNSSGGLKRAVAVTQQ